MYIQITTRCNMECIHCCYSCTTNGDDMDIETYKAALRLAEEYGETIAIGGGEPTVHPNFWEFVGLALAYAPEDLIPWMATNGKKTETALRLARLAKRGVMAVDLSLDEYHDRIDGSVITAFTPQPRGYISGHNNGYIGIRDVTQNGAKDPIPAGRAKDWASAEEDNQCVCNELFVDPQGNIWACGHQDLSYGTVYEPHIPDAIPDGGRCPHQNHNHQEVRS